LQRFSIFKAMAVVALAAVNFAAIRAVLPGRGHWEPNGIFLVGLLPLANAPIIAILLLALRYHSSLRRRPLEERVGMMPAFAVASALTLIVWITACVFAPEGVLQYLQFVLVRVDGFIRSLGFQDRDYSSEFFQFIPLPLLVGATMSGPPLVLALILGWFSSRYRVVITPRNRPLASAQATADPHESPSHG
jgi:hypothetical protein